MDRFVLKMLAKKTKDRYKNTSEMRQSSAISSPSRRISPNTPPRKKEEEVRYQSTLRNRVLGQPGRPSQATALERQPRFRQGRGRKEKSDCQAGADPERGKSRTRQAGGCGGPRRVAPFAEGCAPPSPSLNQSNNIRRGTVTPGKCPPRIPKRAIRKEPGMLSRPAAIPNRPAIHRRPVTRGQAIRRKVIHKAILPPGTPESGYPGAGRRPVIPNPVIRTRSPRCLPTSASSANAATKRAGTGRPAAR